LIGGFEIRVRVQDRVREKTIRRKPEFIVRGLGLGFRYLRQ
jgi:hypothetical protein